ncbi:MAG: exo-alpha-sialidase [Planctomycetes bacterium]|nr:exo-alpha-sialidase [Planctomycetota bacterium]
MTLELHIGTRKGLFTAVRRGRGTWRLAEPEFVGVAVSMVLHDPRDGARYAALDHGHFGSKLQRHDGRRWREIGVPVYPQLPRGKVEKEGMGRPWPRSLRLIWALAIDPGNAGGLWCGTIPGGLFRSADRGKTWALVNSLWNVRSRRRWFGGGFDTPGIHSVLVDPRDPQVVTVGISCGGVWRTIDGGERWTQTAHGMRADFMPKERAADPDIQDPHRLAHCLAAPDRQWTQHHCGIWRRDQPDEPWQEVRAKAPSRFGFACVAHPQDPDVAWFVPAVKDECRVPVDGRLVVTQTRDGGRSLQVLAQGLPRRSWDLVWRHGLDVAADGNTLAMGSTSGGLWISEDGGRRWQAIDERLPPIACVRFAPS